MAKNVGDFSSKWKNVVGQGCPTYDSQYTGRGQGWKARQDRIL
jgi:hypothetical protein